MVDVLDPAVFLARESGAFSGRMRRVQLGPEKRDNAV